MIGDHGDAITMLFTHPAVDLVFVDVALFQAKSDILIWLMWIKVFIAFFPPLSTPLQQHHLSLGQMALWKDRIGVQVYAP